MAKEKEKSDHISHWQSLFAQEALGVLAVHKRRIFTELCLDYGSFSTPDTHTHTHTHTHIPVFLVFMVQNLQPRTT